MQGITDERWKLHKKWDTAAMIQDKWIIVGQNYEVGSKFYLKPLALIYFNGFPLGDWVTSCV